MHLYTHFWNAIPTFFSFFLGLFRSSVQFYDNNFQFFVSFFFGGRRRFNELHRHNSKLFNWINKLDKRKEVDKTQISSIKSINYDKLLRYDTIRFRIQNIDSLNINNLKTALIYRVFLLLSFQTNCFIISSSFYMNFILDSSIFFPSRSVVPLNPFALHRLLEHFCSLFYHVHFD